MVRKTEPPGDRPGRVVARAGLEAAACTAALTDQGIYLFNMQMGGMLVGGILWGMLGDKRGRLSVMFGSITLYSIANIANGMVHSVDSYAIWRLRRGRRPRRRARRRRHVGQRADGTRQARHRRDVDRSARRLGRRARRPDRWRVPGRRTSVVARRVLHRRRARHRAARPPDRRRRIGHVPRDRREEGHRARQLLRALHESPPPHALPRDHPRRPTDLVRHRHRVHVRRRSRHGKLGLSPAPNPATALFFCYGSCSLGGLAAGMLSQ